MEPEKVTDDAEEDTGSTARVLKAEDLFGDDRELWIELGGVRYRLRITRRGKLILQK